MAKKVLVVDDDPVLLTVHETALKEAGYEVATAQNGKEAFEKFMQVVGTDEQFDAIVTDGNMPEMDGLDLIANVRSDPAHEGVLIVMYTGNNEEYCEMAVRAGADHVFQKPNELLQLVEYVKSRLGGTP